MRRWEVRIQIMARTRLLMQKPKSLKVPQHRKKTRLRNNKTVRSQATANRICPIGAVAGFNMISMS